MTQPTNVQYKVMKGTSNQLEQSMAVLQLSTTQRQAVGRTLKDIVKCLSDRQSLETLAGYTHKLSPLNPRTVWNVPVSGHDLQLSVIYYVDYPYVVPLTVSKKTT
ncbi:hypothetical protein [Euzebya tangerina]|uniref:hypothetical protein n=1 Tax=Euzebya tangerina TaxID=591198 RepID=UPI000E3249D7|nr:hypothetical protein [Euzebya tangerina]